MYAHIYIYIKKKSLENPPASALGAAGAAGTCHCIQTCFCMFLLTHIEMQLRVGVWFGDSRGLAFTALRPKSMQELLATCMVSRFLYALAFYVIPRYCGICPSIPCLHEAEAGGLWWGGEELSHNCHPGTGMLEAEGSGVQFSSAT